MSTQSLLKQSLERFKSEFAIVMALSLLANLLMLTPTVYLLQVFDRIMISQNETTLIVMTALAFAMFAVIAAAEWLRARLLVNVGARFDKRMSPVIFDRVHRSNLIQFSGSSRAFYDLTELRQFLTGQGVIALSDLPWSSVYIVVLFLLHPYLGWLAIAFIMIQGVFVWRNHAIAVEPIQHAQALLADENKFLATKVRGEEVIEVLGMTPAFREAWELKRSLTLAASSKSQSLIHRTTSQVKFVRLTQQSLSLAAGALLVLEGELSPGAMIAANILVSRALAPMDLISSGWQSWLGAREAYRRLSDLEGSTSQSKQSTPLNSLPFKLEGPLRLIDVSVRLPGANGVLLQSVNYSAEPGTLTIIQGNSGEGKTTLGRVILGIWPFFSGQILLGKHVLHSWPRQQLGPFIGYLPQDIELLNGTVSENISRFGVLNPDMVVQAAQMTGLHQRVLHMPQGYDSPIGEGGRLLSGGERQRIGLARAVYGLPRLIVLDEPNANLDDEGNKSLAVTLQELKTQGCIVFVISHRPGLATLADAVLNVSNGQVIVQKGGRSE